MILAHMASKRQSQKVPQAVRIRLMTDYGTVDAASVRTARDCHGFDRGAAITTTVTALYTSSISGRYRRPLSPLMVQQVLQRDEAANAGEW
jgi:hypothetical protein